MIAGEFVGTTPFAEGIYGADMGGGQLSSLESGARVTSGGLAMGGTALALYGGAMGFTAPEPAVQLGTSAGQQLCIAIPPKANFRMVWFRARSLSQPA